MNTGRPERSAKRRRCEDAVELPLDLGTRASRVRSSLESERSSPAPATSIEELPEECLREIILRVPLRDRIKLRRVCSKWAEIVDDCWRAVTNLAIVGAPAGSEKSEIEGIVDAVNIVSPMRSLLPEILRQPCTKTAFSNIPIAYLVTKFLSVCPRKYLPSSPPRTYHKGIVLTCSNLKKLTTHFIDDDFMYIIGNKIDLEELRIEWNVYCVWNYQILRPILNLKNLRKLSLDSALAVRNGVCVQLQLPLHNHFIRLLAANLVHLESLSIGACHKISDDSNDPSFLGLSHLKRLRELRITGCLNFKGRYLSSLPHLEVLSLTGSGIVDEGIIKLLRVARNLRALYLGGTYITEQTVLVAIEETKKRTNGICLTLDINCTNINLDKIPETPPLLEIVI